MQISQSIAEVVNNASASVNVSKEASDIASKGKEVVEKTVGYMVKIAETGVKLVEEAKSALNMIVDTSEKAAETVQMILKAAEEQSESAEQVLKNMEDILIVAQHSAEATGQIKQSSTSLEQMSLDLQKRIRVFKV